MGTRSTTTVYQGEEPLLTMYRQYDGYWDGHGKELKELLAGMTIVNGLSGSTENLANGMGCLAAQLVAHFKKGAGSFYIAALNDKQSYHYEIHGKPGDPVHLKAFVYDKLEYDGPISDFNPEGEPEED